jgi:hypothetical protein
MRSLIHEDNLFRQEDSSDGTIFEEIEMFGVNTTKGNREPQSVSEKFVNMNHSSQTERWGWAGQPIRTIQEWFSEIIRPLNFYREVR